MKGRLVVSKLAVGAITGFIVLGGGASRAGETIKKFEADKGPKTIDVSRYPKEMQDIYSNVFSKKCSKCHTLARPINTNKKADDWEKYVEKMMKKPNSGIDKKSAKKIKDFIAYDQKNRKDKKG